MTIGGIARTGSRATPIATSSRACELVCERGSPSDTSTKPSASGVAGANACPTFGCLSSVVGVGGGRAAIQLCVCGVRWVCLYDCVWVLYGVVESCVCECERVLWVPCFVQQLKYPVLDF
mgnify:CR=1 FL=1